MFSPNSLECCPVEIFPVHTIQQSSHPCMAVEHLKSFQYAGGTEILFYLLFKIWASLVAQMVKNPPSLQETWVQSLAWEDSLEEGMTTHSSILALRNPWTEEPGGLQSMGSQRVGHNWNELAHTQISFNDIKGRMRKYRVLYLFTYVLSRMLFIS